MGATWPVPPRALWTTLAEWGRKGLSNRLQSEAAWVREFAQL